MNAVLWREMRVSARHRRLGWHVSIGLWLCVALVAVVSAQMGPRIAAGGGAPAGRVLVGVLLVTLSVLIAIVPPFTAGRALSNERRRQTFDVLIITPLTARDILRGKLLGSLLPTFLILGATLPLAMLLRLYGGFTVWHVLLSYVFLFQEALVMGLVGQAAAIFGGDNHRVGEIGLIACIGVLLVATPALDVLFGGGILWWIKLPVVAGFAIWLIGDTANRLARRRGMDDVSSELWQAMLFLVFAILLAIGLALDISRGGPTLRYLNPVLAMASMTGIPVGFTPAAGNFVVALVVYLLLPGALFPQLAYRLQRYFNTELPHERGIFF